MVSLSSVSDQVRGPAAPRRVPDLAVAFAIAFCVYAAYAVAGFPTLANPQGDNDSLLRLVEVRDLLGGQGWFDLHQYRMGPSGGFVMHWSRFIDAPLALIMLAASALGAGPPLAESIALVAWPFLLTALTLFAMIRLARALGDASVVFPAAVVGIGSLYFLGLFRPGSIDHHNAQLALAIGMIVCLVRGPESRAYSLLAGLCAAIMLAIGMETAPYVAVAGAVMALAYLLEGGREARRAADFGLSFAVASATAFLATVGPSNWLTPVCDALSNVQLSLAALGGFGLAAVAHWRIGGVDWRGRLAALLAVGVVVAAAARVFFPQCLADPYAGVDPMMRELWLDYVSEAQSIVALARADWTNLLGYYATPFLAMVVLAAMMLRGGLNRSIAIFFAFMVTAFLVSCWQVRGSYFAIPFATTALALWLAAFRKRAEAAPSPRNSLMLVAGWLLSVNVAWAMLANQIHTHLTAHGQAAATDEAACSARASFAELAGLPAGTVAAVTDLGSPILAYTPHRALAGPYHRNIDGNLIAYRALLDPAVEAERRLRAAGVDYVVVCAANGENANLTTRAPGGLDADLLAGRVPSWLDQRAAGPLAIYALRPQAAAATP